MQLTPNYRLRKPDGTDPVDVQDLNDNMDVLDAEVAKKAEKTGAATDMVVAFKQEEKREQLESGEKLSLSLGKIKKWFADLKKVAFSGDYADLTGKPAIPAGGIADASKIIDDIDDIAANTQAGYMAGALALKKVNSDLSALNDSGAIIGMNAREDGVYITYHNGADTVIKKLGSVLYAGFLTPTSYNQNGPGNANFDLKPLLSNYASLTTANMCIEATYFKGFEARVNNLSIQGGTGYTYTYDATTGMLTVSGIGTVNYSYKSRPEKIKLVVLQDDIA